MWWEWEWYVDVYGNLVGSVRFDGTESDDMSELILTYLREIEPLIWYQLVDAKGEPCEGTRPSRCSLEPDAIPDVVSLCDAVWKKNPNKLV
jgi:hypothetical protein